MGQLSILAVLLLVLSSGCTYDLARFLFVSGSRPPHVPELDDYVINLEGIQRTSSREAVRAILGEPPFVNYGSGELQWTSWWYPIRNIGAVPLPDGAKRQRRVIPAVGLRIWLDASGRVEKWGFFHPVNNSAMELRESLEQADSQLGERCKPRRIELSVILRQGTSKEKVLEGMRWFEGMIVASEFKGSQVHISREGQQEILTYYADHPSPLYIPPNYVVVTFYAQEDLGTALHFEGWGGCK
jgi:hypothetical protein